MTVQFLGQNCFLFTHKGKNILSDPFYNFQKQQSGFDLANHQIDYLLITHAHEDHTADVKEVLAQYPDAVVIAQPEVCGYFKHQNNIDLNIGGTTEIEGLRITMVQAAHTSSFPDGSYGGEPCGYMLNDGEKNIYFAGDTGIMAEMKLFPTIFGAIDCAILPIGGHYTMDAHMASIAATFLETQKVIACHFDTFPPIKIDHQEAKRTFESKKVELVLPQLGECIQG